MSASRSRSGSYSARPSSPTRSGSYGARATSPTRSGSYSARPTSPTRSSSYGARATSPTRSGSYGARSSTSSAYRSRLNDADLNQAAQDYSSAHEDEVQNGQWHQFVGDFARQYGLRVNDAAHILAPLYDHMKSDLGIPERRSRSRSSSGASRTNSWIETLRAEIPQLKKVFPNINAIEASHALHQYYTAGGSSGVGSFDYDAFGRDLKAAGNGQGPLAGNVSTGEKFMRRSSSPSQLRTAEPTSAYQTRSRTSSGAGYSRPLSPSSPSASPTNRSYARRNSSGYAMNQGHGATSPNYGRSYNRFGY